MQRDSRIIFLGPRAFAVAFTVVCATFVGLAAGADWLTERLDTSATTADVATVPVRLAAAAPPPVAPVVASSARMPVAPHTIVLPALAPQPHLPHSPTLAPALVITNAPAPGRTASPAQRTAMPAPITAPPAQRSATPAPARAAATPVAPASAVKAAVVALVPAAATPVASRIPVTQPNPGRLARHAPAARTRHARHAVPHRSPPPSASSEPVAILVRPAQAARAANAAAAFAPAAAGDLLIHAGAGNALIVHPQSSREALASPP